MSIAAAKSLQLCPTLCDPIDGSPPGSSVHRILQARILEWVAISFSTWALGTSYTCHAAESSPQPWKVNYYYSHTINGSKGSTGWMKWLAEVSQLGRSYLHCKSRCNVKAKCRHALKEKCTVAREQNSEGPRALGSWPWRGLFFRKGAAVPSLWEGPSLPVWDCPACYRVSIPSTTQTVSPRLCDNTLPFPSASRGQYKSSFSWKPLQEKWKGHRERDSELTAAQVSKSVCF